MWFQEKPTLFGAESITVMWVAGGLSAKLSCRAVMANEPTDMVVKCNFSFTLFLSKQPPGFNRVFYKVPLCLWHKPR